MMILALDYGEKTVGVASTDALGMTAIPRETIFREIPSHLRQTLARIEILVQENKIERIILGYPVHLDGTVSPMSEQVEVFKKKLESRVKIPVFLFDERLTTQEADELLAGSGVPKSERKKTIDAVAASILLRDYLNAQEREQDE